MNPLRIVALLLAVAVWTPAGAQPSAYASRAEAIRGLAAPDPAHRVDAVVWIAANGTAADERLLRPRLADESAMVRELAERGLWILWNRSGDPRDRRADGEGCRAGAGGRTRGGNRDLFRSRPAQAGLRRGLESSRYRVLPRSATSSARSPTATR